MSGASPKSGLVDNWQAGKTVTECNLHMLDTEDLSDVTFRVGSDEQVVRAHRYVLVSRSCVFHAMFCGPLAETGEVTIPDIEADIFKEFLRYVYTDKTNVNAETVTGLMYTSRKYSLDSLFNLCVTFLVKSLSEDNVCQILEQCHGFGELDLERKALKILTEGGKRVVKSPGFVDLCPDCLEMFLKSNNRKVKEEDLFEAAMSWTEERCRKEGVSDTPENRQRLLGDMRYEIRFTSMPLEYLAHIVGPSGMLTQEEGERIMDQKRVAYEFRRNVTTSFKYVSRLQYYETRVTKPGRHAVSFSPSWDIQLQGCQLYGGRLRTEEYTLSIRVYGPNNMVIAEPVRNASLELHGRRQRSNVLFPSSVSLTAGATYTLCVDMEGPATARGWGGKDTVQFTFRPSPMSDTGTSLREGQIPGLIFSLRSKTS
ncbi:BTB/POZ domain-containing protein 2-like isoform X2 [Haliotis rufescens]|uniref:BTB/POZ domain-containing protein 2-like isoform X2 n=1 Tax=Haliotis rufescens TaxID=6454 RepID=UPI00201F5EBA|nr:BTB/POZ domain-containing protein 2-like isoform X2 [Haliotis rufescens]